MKGNKEKEVNAGKKHTNPSDFNALILLDHDILLLSVSPENDKILLLQNKCWKWKPEKE